MDRKARLAHQGNVFQRSSRFDLVQGDRIAQRFDRREIDRTPIAFFRGGIGISGADDFGNADDRLVGHAVIKENFITQRILQRLFRAVKLRTPVQLVFFSLTRSFQEYEFGSDFTSQ